MTQATINNYWIAHNALNIALNALGNSEYIQCSIASGAIIMCYMKDINGLEYDNGHNYRRWTLTAYPTVFVSTSRKYVYVAIPRDNTSTSPALLCFPSIELDIYGCSHEYQKDEEGNIVYVAEKNADDTTKTDEKGNVVYSTTPVDVSKQVGSTDYYYISLQGIISSSESGTRKWEKEIVTGILSTDEAYSTQDSEWYQYDATNKITTFIKNLTMKAGTFFSNFFTKKVIFTNGTAEQGTLESVPSFSSLDNASDTEAVSTAYLKDFYDKLGNDIFLRKDKDDETTHKLTMADAEVKNTLKTKNEVVTGAISSDNFVTGAPLSGAGWQINHDGAIEADSLALRNFLEVPELRFNRASVTPGTSIQSPCGGIIATVTPLDSITGKATLKLGDDDIAGSIDIDDLCWGYWHDVSTKSNNAKEDSDDRAGIINYGGFCTVYFSIKEILNKNSTEFLYELRPDINEDGSLKYPQHPYAGMHFGGRGNFTNLGRQGFKITTPNYSAQYQLVSGWDWSNLGKYIVKVSGLLDGFEALVGVTPGTWEEKYGTIDCNVYMRGVIQQVDNDQRMLYITEASNGIIDEGEKETVTIVIRDNYFSDRTSEFDIYINDSKVYEKGSESPCVLVYPYSSLPDEINHFSVKAVGTHTIEEWDEETQKYVSKDKEITITDGFVIHKHTPVTYSIVTNVDNDPFIDNKEPKRIQCEVYTNAGLDITDSIDSWTITRESSDSDADAIWAQRDKVKNFSKEWHDPDADKDTVPGEIYLWWSDDVSKNDIDLTVDTTKFHIKAAMGGEEVTTTINI